VRAPFASALTLGVIGIALALPASLQLVVQNARIASSGWQSALDVSVYLQPALSERDGAQLAERVAARADVVSARFVGATEGMAEFRRWSGLGQALDALQDNPLPGMIVVRPRVAGGGSDFSSVEQLAQALRSVPGVDQVQLDSDWVRRFAAILDTLRRAAALLATLLGLGVLMIVGNTVRLDIDARRTEIEVVKLVGGSDGFVRRPFLYGGLWYGLGGALVAWLLVEALALALAGPVGRVAAAYGSTFTLQGLGLRAALTLLGTGTGLGWLGAFVAATRHLRAIEPGHES
jgi:cell division transport system permease protein